MAADTITVPRPGPDELILVAVDAEGAIAWTRFPRAVAADGELLAQLVPLLGEAQEILHERAGRPQ